MPEHVCPAFANPPHTRPETALARLASAHTICGSFPPSSSTEPFIRRAHSSPTPRPTSTEPVKKIFAALDSTSAWPTAPPPWTVRSSPSGKPGALEDVLDALADQRRERGRLEDDAVAGHQRDRHLAERDRPRVVPGRDHPDDPERLVDEGRLLLLQHQLRVADRLVGQDLRAVVGAPMQRVDRRQHLHRVGLDPRLALLARDQRGDRVGVIEQDRCCPPQVVRPLLRGELSPEGLDPGDVVDDALHLRGRDRRDRADQRAGRGVERLQVALAGRLSGRRCGRCCGGGLHAPQSVACGWATCCEG